MPTAEELELIHTYLEKHPNCSLDGPEMYTRITRMFVTSTPESSLTFTHIMFFHQVSLPTVSDRLFP